MENEDRHLNKRGGHWYYLRRVPKHAFLFDTRRLIRSSLKTKSLEIARIRRDAIEVADDEFWATMIVFDTGELSSEAEIKYKNTLARRYKSAQKRAVAHGFLYAPMEKLVDTVSLDEVMDRIQIVKKVSGDRPSRAEKDEAEALLGGAQEPKVTVSEAFDLYCDEIAVGDLINKSPKQKKLWMKTKRRGIAYFIDVVGDKAMTEIVRKDGLDYYKWWAGRLQPKGKEKPLKANTANRDIGNMRLLYSAYFKHIGDEDRQNPLRNLSFKDSSPTEVPAFSDKWVRSKILIPDVFDGLNTEAVSIVYALIETGCRPSEIANLMPDDIILGEKVPYIRIRPRQGREIKTQSSIRNIPLVGVSLAAMKASPKGFPHYRDRNDLLSASLMKAFRHRKLFPTDKHIIYSFRHSFEKRMLEAELDYGFRCMMMGHAHSRPAYGDGGSMKYRQNQLLKIAHPFSKIIFNLGK